MSMKHDWSPERYLQFASERSRPAMDLLARVGSISGKVIYDLGCGPGNSTSLLLAAYPGAFVTGVDNSPAMLERARKDVAEAEFLLADLSDWKVPADADLLFSNATFQWVPNHAEVMKRMLSAAKTGAALAVQMPNNLDEPSHSAMRLVAQNNRWSGLVGEAGSVRERLLSPAGYQDQLGGECRSLNIWQTTYYHRLADHQAILDFVSSTGLRPYLDPLSPAEQDAFKAAYVEKLKHAYTLQEDGTVLLPFPRLFIVAVR